jgi:hypothetical protein
MLKYLLNEEGVSIGLVGSVREFWGGALQLIYAEISRLAQHRVTDGAVPVPLWHYRPRRKKTE